MANSVLSRSFTKREKIMLVVLAIILVCGAYYLFVIQAIQNNNAANAAELETVQTEIDTQTGIALLKSRMDSELKSLGDEANLPLVATYDNVRAEIDELNAILKDATTYSLNFAQPTLSGETVRRTVSLTFTTPDYGSALELVRTLQACKYRCEITDFALTGKMLADGSVESVSGSLNVTFYETTDGATNLSGLVEESPKK